MAFYLLDWDNNGRQETLTAQTTAGGVLDGARAFDSIGGGVWATYTVCGSADFVVTHTAGLNAVVSGVFFGAPVAAGTTNYVVDGSGGVSQVVAETDGSGNLTAHYVRVGGQLLAVMRPGGSGGMWTTRFVHADGLGSVRALTDETGNVVDTRGYEAFGTKNVEAGSDPLAYGFAGEAFDGATHLAYHRARWMDARVGRFTGMDRVDADDMRPSTLQRYSYVTNEPTGQVDPTGNEGVDAEQMNFFGYVGPLATFWAGNGTRIDMRARPIEFAHLGFLADHLYLVYTDQQKHQWVYEGGPAHGPKLTWSGVDFGDLGAGKYDMGIPAVAQEHSSTDATVPLAADETAIIGSQCLDRAIVTISSLHTKYGFLGPNSNTAAHYMCGLCGLPFGIPPCSNPIGWSDPIANGPSGFPEQP